MNCELCGKETDSLTKTKIEGATLKVCDSCSDLGEKKSGPSKKKTTKKKKHRTSTKTSGKVLVHNYGQKIKTAREAEGYSIKELADELNEKESVIKKVEKQDLKVNQAIAKKLKDKFGLDLYTNPEVSDYGASEKGDSRSATLKDVADIKESE